MRRTKQAETIRAVISSHPAPLSVAELYQKAKAIAPGIGIATIYRHLGTWLDEGRLVPVEFTGQPCRYELAGKAHHHHFLCRSCGQVFELPGCVSGLHSLLPEGFQAQQHELTIYGACRACAASKDNENAN